MVEPNGSLNRSGFSIRVGVWRRGGPPPGYEWTVLILRHSYEDALKLLDESQREYIVLQVQDLATHRNPTRSQTLSLDQIGSFYELREKGGGVGKGINVRVYYDLVDADRVIRILGVDVKKNEGSISLPIRERILRRQTRWNAGDYPLAVIRRLKMVNEKAARDGTVDSDK